MPRLYVLSDLHREFAGFEPEPRDAEIVVLAGDIDHGVKGLEWARAAFPALPVVYVAGNHEYYGETIPDLTFRLAEHARSLGVHFLENAAADLGGLRFLGCTLWTDLQLFGAGQSVAGQVARALPDYRAIRVSPHFRRLRPEDTAAWHRKSVRWLREALSAREQPSVVVTHHAPSIRSVAPAHRTDPVTAAFASRLDQLIERTQPVLWIHGHTHLSVDYTLGATRILSNQKGYLEEPGTGFDPGLVIEVPGVECEWPEP